MEILKQYNEDTLQLISSGSYELKPFDEMYVDSYFDLIYAYGNQTDVTKVDWGNAHWNTGGGKAGGRGYPKIKLSVFSDVGSFLENEDLEQDLDFYISNGQIFLKPNEYLDRTGFSENNYNLQFDFIQRFKENDIFYISEISPSRKEIRIEANEKIYGDPFDNNLKNQILYFLKQGDIDDANEIFSDMPDSFRNYSTGDYNFNSFLELSQGRLLPINGYAFDNITNNKRTLIIKLNQPLPNNVST